jgi:ubiquinone/menaquinone biosynthesis C-methylase UbiE
MAAQLDLKADDELLDVGCGSASLLAGPARHVRHVAGVDASEIQLGMARQRLADRIADGTAEIVEGDAAALPWADGRFSAVSCQACLPFLPDPEQAMREMLRVLRPGGRVVITAFPATTHDPSGAIDAYGEWRWSAGDLQRLVEQVGFGDVSVTHLPERELGVLLARGVKPT